MLLSLAHHHQDQNNNTTTTVKNIISAMEPGQELSRQKNRQPSPWSSSLDEDDDTVLGLVLLLTTTSYMACPHHPHAVCMNTSVVIMEITRGPLPTHSLILSPAKDRSHTGQDVMLMAVGAGRLPACWDRG